ncbi:hypothetical protein niasHT_025888 [Heterodera trifolii]|uniref:Uncharacterized protein n=1 Tax=Heterodera trifolii TaxID=157864 RepID=A0ABD2KJ65_9BILA
MHCATKTPPHTDGFVACGSTDVHCAQIQKYIAANDLSAEFHHTAILRFVRSAVLPQLFDMDRPKQTPTNASTPEEQQRMEYRIRKRYNSAGFLGFEGENATLEELILLRSTGPQRSKRLPPEAPPKPLVWQCTKCSHKPFETLRALSTHMRIHSGATHSPVRRPSIHTTIDFSAASPEPEEPPKAPEPPTEVPQERWVDPLPEKLQFQQQENKFAELKCKYSRANAKVRWYKGRKELFSDGPKYEILIDKQSITLIINNPDPDDSGKYTCKANGVPTNSFVTVEEPPIKYVFLTPLPNTMEIYRTKQGVLTCKLNSARAPLVWQRDDEKPIDVDDPRYQIEKDAAGCFTLTIRVVEQIDQGMWTATVNKDVISKCQVYVVEDPRDTFVMPEQLRNEQAAIEALRRANAEHELRPNDEQETESSDVDEDEYVVESDDDIPAVEDNAGAAPTASSCSSVTTSTAGIVVTSAAERRSDVNSFRVKTAATSSSTASAARTAIVSAVSDKDASDQPSSSTARRREPRKQKSARKDAIELTPLDIHCSKNLTLPRPKNTERTASGSGRRRVGSTAADRPAQAAAAAFAAGEEAPDDRDKVPGVTPVTADGKTKKYGAENESREKPRLAKRTKQSAPADRSLRVRGQTSGEPVVLNFDRTRAELELVAPASNCCINVLTPVRPSQRGKCGRSRANTANAGAALAASCEDRFLKPQIITAQRKWKVRAGRTLSLCIKFVGTPDPSVCWVKAGGAGTLPPELIMEEHIKGNTSIFFPAAKRSESGTYELRLKNNVGETEGHFEVLVQDRPAPPKRPLAVDNVARDSCTLSWQPPEDDGGSEVTNYVVECRDVGSQVWLPVNNVVGTNSTVPNLQEGHEYQFRVCAVNAFGCSDPLNTDSDVLAMDPYDPPGRPEVTHHDNNQISIKWAPSTDTGGSPIAHYDVQRKDAKTRRWIKVNTHPVYDCAYTDEGVQPEHGYYYRVVAVNEAGLDKPSDQSELAWAKPKFEAPRFELDGINGKEVRVRAGHANTRQYIPKSARSGSGQCRIVATNEKGTAETRGLISVVDRPGPPEGPITYPATTKHSITLSWRPPKDDGGTELSSYRIEFKGLDERDWERVPDHVTLPNYTVRNLEKGAQYQFRVFAENMVGISEPLNGEPVTAKDPFDTPKAQRTRSATVQRKSRRLAPVECAASAAQNADKPLAQNTSEERRTTRSAGTGAAPLAAPLTSPRQRVVNAVNGASSLHRLLSLCDNREVATWDQIGTFSETKKLGEGSYCEVFSTKNHGDVVVMKVVPFQFDGQRRESINGTGAQPSSSMVHHELLLTKQLSLLSQPNEQHMAASFLQLVGAFVVKGKLPQQIVAAWDYFKTNNDEKAQNRHPDRYVNDEQPFMVMYLNFAGTDLEDFIKKNNSQNTATRRRSIFRQIRLALAIAENVYNLEHRDLHLSNVLVVKFGQTEQLRFKLNGQLIEEETDVKVTIIDYGLSRIEIDGKPYFRQLEGIFEGVGGHSDVYRRMAVATGHKWDQSWPITNTLIGALSRTKTILEVSGEGSERGRTGPKEMNGDGRVVKNGDGRGAKEVNGDGGKERKLRKGKIFMRMPSSYFRTPTTTTTIAMTTTAIIHDSSTIGHPNGTHKNNCFSALSECPFLSRSSCVGTALTTFHGCQCNRRMGERQRKGRRDGRRRAPSAQCFPQKLALSSNALHRFGGDFNRTDGTEINGQFQRIETVGLFPKFPRFFAFWNFRWTRRIASSARIGLHSMGQCERKRNVLLAAERLGLHRRHGLFAGTNQCRKGRRNGHRKCRYVVRLDGQRKRIIETTMDSFGHCFTVRHHCVPSICDSSFLCQHIFNAFFEIAYPMLSYWVRRWCFKFPRQRNKNVNGFVKNGVKQLNVSVRTSNSAYMSRTSVNVVYQQFLFEEAQRFQIHNNHFHPIRNKQCWSASEK